MVLTEDEFDTETLASAAESILTDGNLASQMATAALSLGVPDAADQLADLVEAIAAEGT